jgi:Skp family chaperone for outer membrane proteins
MALAWLRGIFFGLTWALFLGVGQGAMAQELATADFTSGAKTSAYRIPILTLSPEELYTRSKFGDTVKKRAEAFATQLAKENDSFEFALVQEEKDLTELRKTMSADLFASVAAAFDQKVERIRKDQEDKKRQLNQKVETNRKYFFDSILQVLAEIMKKYGADLIVDKSVVFVSFDRIDVTDEAITLIDQMLSLVPDISSPLAPNALDVPNQGN